MLLSALSWGRLCGDPVHNEVRPDVGAAIYSSVSPKEGHRLTRSHQRPDVSGAGHRSSSVLFLPSVGSDPQRRSFYPATRSPTFCLYILSLKRSPLRGVVSPSQERTVPGYSGRCLLEAYSEHLIALPGDSLAGVTLAGLVL